MSRVIDTPDGPPPSSLAIMRGLRRTRSAVILNFPPPDPFGRLERDIAELLRAVAAEEAETRRIARKFAPDGGAAA